VCSISGVIMPEGTSYLSTRLRHIIDQACERGRDSWGTVTLHTDHTYSSVRYTGSPIETGVAGTYLPSSARICISTCRAEPTTEWVREKGIYDIPPFVHGNWACAHNGCIANDKELVQRYGLSLGTSIDTAVIPAVLDKICPDELDLDRIQEFLRDEIEGSYALALVNRRHPDTLILAVNYQQLYIAYDQQAGALFFTSMEEHLYDDTDIHRRLVQGGVVEVPAYSMQVVHLPSHRGSTSVMGSSTTLHAGYSTDTGQGSSTAMQGTVQIQGRSLRQSRDVHKALVVCSGGLDSTVAAREMQVRGYDVTLLHFLYKCRAQEGEVEAVRKIAAAMNVPYLFWETDFFTKVGGSRLTNTHGEINREGGGIAGAELAWEWCPARNTVFLAMAAAIAEVHDFECIVLGANLEEAGSYADNTLPFIRKLDAVLPYALNLHHYVRLEAPLVNLMKHEIVALGLKNGAPMEHSYSCYEYGEHHCNNCGPCFLRKTAFKMNGTVDPVFEHLSEDEFWSGCVPYSKRSDPAIVR